jgi:hypothetical protein
MNNKLEITQWVMKHIVDHAREGGSYRYLIYTRLGFGPEAYEPLLSDGMEISNEFDLNLKPALIEALKNQNYKKMRDLLDLCDEPECFNTAGAYFNGQKTCHLHYDRIKK